MNGGENGGRTDRLAPVVPLFGDRSPQSPERMTEADPARRSSGRAEGEVSLHHLRASSGRAEGERDETSHPAEPAWNNTWSDDADEDRDDYYPYGGEYDECTIIEREIAERNLLRKLRTRSLSVAEARVIVAERGLEAALVEAILHTFVDRRYLDDAALAEQLVDKATRRGQGRTAIARAIEQRGIPRDVVDAALAALPDDDAERALEFARSRVRTMEGLDRTVALRRLSGQLARRGYASSALSVARQVLDEQSGDRGTVGFE